MQTFEIFIKDTDIGSTITVHAPDDVTIPARPFPAPDEILTPEHRAILPRIAVSDATSDEIQAVGQALYSALFTPALAMAYGEARGRAQGNLRLCLQIESPALAALPWEAMHDGAVWLSMRSGAPLVRRLGGMDEVEFPPKLGVKDALNVLFIGASPTDAVAIDTTVIADELADRLAKPIEEGLVDLTVLLNASLEDIRRALTQNQGRAKKQFHVVYFLGHGQHDAICLDDGYGEANDDDPRKPREPGEAYWVTAETLAQTFADEQVRLFFLAACETGGQVDQNSGVMQNFVQDLAQRLNLPALVAMQYEVGRGKAAALTAEFFAQLATFQPVDIAMTEARASLVNSQQVTRDVIAPVMYLQSEESAIFKKARNWALLGLTLVLPVIAMLAGIVLWGWMQFEVDNQRALAQSLADQTLHAISEEGDPELILLLAVEATRIMTTAGLEIPDVYSALRQSLVRAPLATYRHDITSGPNPKAIFNANGLRLITATSIGTTELLEPFHLVDATDGAEIVAFEGGDQVEDMFFSPNGHRVAITISNTVRLLDSADGTPIADLTHEDGVIAAVFTPEGSHMVTVSGGESANTLHLWKIATQKIVREKRYPDSLTRPEFNVNGSRLALASSEGTVRLLDAATLQELASFPSAGFAYFNPDGSRFAVPFSDTLQLIDVVDGKILAQLPHETLVGYQAFFNASSDRLATVVSDTVKLWDTLNGQELGSFPYDTRPGVGLDFNASGSRLLIGDDAEGVAYLVDSTSGRKIKTTERVIGTPVAFSEDGLEFALVSVSGVHLFDSNVGNEIGVLPELQPVQRLIFNKDGTRLVARLDYIGMNGLHLWDTVRGETVYEAEDLQGVWGEKFSPDGSLLTFGSPHRVHIVDASSGILLSVHSHDSSWPAHQFSPEGDKIATMGDKDGLVRLWNSYGGIEPRIRLLGGKVQNVDSDNRVYHISTQGPISTLRLLDLDTGEEVSALQTDELVYRFLFNQDGSRLITAGPTFPGSSSSHETIRLVESATGRILTTYESSYGITRIIFSDDGTQVGFDDWYSTTVHIWDSDNGKIVTSFRYSGQVNDLDFSTNGNRLALALSDSTAQILNLDTGSEFSLRHENSVNDVTFNPDGSYLITASNDGTARLWDATSGRELHRLPHDESVYGASFSKDGEMLATWTVDGTVHLWDKNSGRSVRSFEQNDTVQTVVSNSSYLAAYNGYSRIHLWNIGTEESLGTLYTDRLPFQPSGTPPIGFDGSGVRLFAVSVGGIVREWRVDRDVAAMVQDACRTLSRNLSQPEWEEAFGSTVPYRQTCATLPIHWTVVKKVIENGHALVQDGDLRAAEATFQEALEIDPGLDQLRLGLRRSSIRDRNFRFKLDPKEAVSARNLIAQALVDHGSEVARGGDIERANAVFASALEWDPGVTEQVSAAMQAAAREMIAEAQVAATQGRATDVEKVTTLLQKAQGLDAQSVLTPTIEARQLLCNAITQRGDNLARAGKIDQATMLYEEAFTLDLELTVTPQERAQAVAADALLEQGLALQRDRRLDEAMSRYIEASEIDPSNATVYAQRGYIHTLQKSYEKAVVDYTTALALQPDIQRSLYYWRGVANFHLGNYQETVDDFGRYIEDSQKRRGPILVTPPDEPICSATPFFHQVNLGYTSTDRALVWRGEAYLAQDLETEAMADFTEAVKRAPDQYEHHNTLCRYGSLLGYAADVIGSCDQAVALTSQSADSFSKEKTIANSRDSRGLARAMTGDIEGAIADFKAFVETYQGDPHADQRQEWIEMLENGNNPFENQSLLKELRQQ